MIKRVKSAAKKKTCYKAGVMCVRIMSKKPKARGMSIKNVVRLSENYAK